MKNNEKPLPVFETTFWDTLFITILAFLNAWRANQKHAC
jgi:hypothetical protein